MMVARYRALTPVMTGGQGYGRAVEMMVARYRALTLSVLDGEDGIGHCNVEMMVARYRVLTQVIRGQTPDSFDP